MNIKIIDNFLQNEDLEILSKLSNKVEAVEKQGLDIKKIDDIELIDQLNDKYHLKSMEILKEMCPDKIKLYDYTQYAIVETGSKFKFPIHDDDPNKILSGVIYLKPEKNTGTIFYSNKKGDNPKVIEWKINRAIFFSRKERKTWHSYEGNGLENRIVLVYNLMTKNVKKVYEIENKNYFFGLLRWKLNSYLYRFLGFII